MNLKRIIKEGIDDSLDWIKDTPEVTIGGKNGLPIESVPLGTKIVAPNGHVFTMEDVTGFHMPHQFVWGSDLESPWLGPKNDDGNKNWHNALWLRRATPEDLNESEELDWSFYPNPAQRAIRLTSPIDQKINYRIFDFTGRILQSGAVMKFENVDISNLKSGSYLIQIGHTSKTLIVY